jgi:DNA-binding MarR family transcriptional regulator
MARYADMPSPDDGYLALVLDADLRLLDVADRLRQHWRKLAQQLDYDASNLTTLVDKLAARGALERQADPGDRRVKALVLTAEGQRLREEFWRNLVTDAGPLAPLRESDLRALTRLLARLDQPTG